MKQIKLKIHRTNIKGKCTKTITVEKPKKKIDIPPVIFAENTYCLDTLSVKSSTMGNWDEDGTGVTAYLNFNNALMVDRKGNPVPNFIVAAHELIHVYNQVYGTVHGIDEETRTGRWTR